jgi:glycosyltransferase involved in cell wall biosynthesis
VDASTGGFAGRAWRLARAFRSARADAVHCHNLAATVVAAPAAWVSGVRTILATRHGLVGPPQPGNREGRFWTVARACDHVVAVCEAAQQHLKRGAGNAAAKVVLIRNGASPAVGGRLASPGARAGSRFTLVCVARLNAIKGHRSLLQALALVRRDIPVVRLVLVGDGPERTALEALSGQLGLADRVEFVGERLNPGQWLEAADLFVLPSETEGLPVALIEAFAAGLPVVVTDVGGMPELVNRAAAGSVVPPADPRALADAIVARAASPAGLAASGSRALQFYRDQLTPERMHADYWRLMNAGAV